MASTDTQAQGSYLGHPSPTVEDIESFPRIKTGIETTHDTTDPVLPEIKTDDDPFSGHRQEVNPFAENGVEKNEAVTSGSPTSPVDRRTSTDEWDAAKTPPSRFQQRKGSVYATPGSRDGHVDKNYARDAKFHELVDKKYGTGKRRPSSSN